jgi:predicted SAM-dependent methyltransferase
MHPRLNLGCGTDILPDWENVDHLRLPGVDTVHNLAIYPWPFVTQSIEEIRAIDLLEHLPSHTQDLRPGVVAFIEECWRLLIPHGHLFIQSPGDQAAFAWTDPTHVRTFTAESMDFFDPDTPFGSSTGFYSECHFKVHTTVLANGNLQWRMWKR